LSVALPQDVPPAWPDALADDPDWRAAIEMGIDVMLLESNLRLTPAERIRQLDAMLSLSDAIQGTATRR
jgi:hypothetical protein